MTLWQVIIIAVLFGAYQDSSATLCMDIQSNILAVWDVLLLTDRATHHENKLFSVNRGGDSKRVDIWTNGYNINQSWAVVGEA